MDRLTGVFREVFDDPSLDIEGLSRDTFPEWDSLAHVKLILGIEEEFGVKFTMDQVTDLRSVEEIRKLLPENTTV